MATLAELWTLMESAPLKEKVSSACLVAAEAIRVEDSETPNHANRVKWAKAVLKDHVQAGDDMLKAVLAANAAVALASISGASDAAIQTAVNNAVNIFADGT